MPASHSTVLKTSAALCGTNDAATRFIMTRLRSGATARLWPSRMARSRYAQTTGGRARKPACWHKTRQITSLQRRNSAPSAYPAVIVQTEHQGPAKQNNRLAGHNRRAREARSQVRGLLPKRKMKTKSRLRHHYGFAQAGK